MRTSTLLPMLVAASSQAFAQGTPPSSDGPYTGALGNATIVRNNPPGVVYRAVFPTEPFFKPAYPDGGNIEGYVIAVANPNGVGVIFSVNWQNLPKTGGPFMYHLHVAPVPDNGNCTATLAHLDPFLRPETPACNPAIPETCQVGDLSGKFGDIPDGSTTFHSDYIDLYASTLEGLGSFFGNRSIVFHYANKTRVSCANFVKVADGELKLQPTHGSCDGGAAAPSGTAPTSNTTLTGPKPTGSTGSTSPPTVTTAAGASLKAGAAGVVAFAAAIAFLL
ncbi:superoxide dismutase [Podospora conica]|nr:superoxide dismutase [Schizothecium conicum]